jgi:hypothetical protein
MNETLESPDGLVRLHLATEALIADAKEAGLEKPWSHLPLSAMIEKPFECWLVAVYELLWTAALARQDSGLLHYMEKEGWPTPAEAWRDPARFVEIERIQGLPNSNKSTPRDRLWNSCTVARREDFIKRIAFCEGEIEREIRLSRLGADNNTTLTDMLRPVLTTRALPVRGGDTQAGFYAEVFRRWIASPPAFAVRLPSGVKESGQKLGGEPQLTPGETWLLGKIIEVPGQTHKFYADQYNPDIERIPALRDVVLSEAGVKTWANQLEKKGRIERRGSRPKKCYPV